MNLKKLAVGVKNLEDLKIKQDLRYKKFNENVHITRLFPKKYEMIKDEGSMYWVINGYISVRQKIIDIKKIEHEDGLKYCHLILDNALIETQAVKQRPFQGWRYLHPERTPMDLNINRKNASSELYRILEDLCII